MREHYVMQCLVIPVDCSYNNYRSGMHADHNMQLDVISARTVIIDVRHYVCICICVLRIAVSAYCVYGYERPHLC